MLKIDIYSQKNGSFIEAQIKIFLKNYPAFSDAIIASHDSDKERPLVRLTSEDFDLQVRKLLIQMQKSGLGLVIEYDIVSKKWDTMFRKG